MICMKSTQYMATFDAKDDARNWCKQKNRACAKAGNTRDIYAVMDGPDDDYAVVDLLTAIELGHGYEVIYA